MEAEPQNNSVLETDYVLLIDNRGNRVISNIKKDRTANIRKKRIKLKDLIGTPYNSTFEVDNNGEIKLLAAQQAEAFEDENAEVIEEEGNPKAIEEETDEKDKANADNRTMVDDNKAQKLTFAEIEQMKKEGLEGQKIIEKLLENSESWNKRTVFSQEKYLKKKMQKHLIQFKVYKVTLDTLVETYFLKNPSYIMSLRFDSLALFLQHAYVYPSSNILMFDNSHGLLLGAVRQRLGTDGEIYVCSPRQEKQDFKEFRIVNELGYTKEDTTNIHYISLKDLDENPDRQYSHLLIASDANPVEIIERTINYIMGGGIIVIFSSFIEPLGECFEYLKNKSCGLNMRINEVFSREMQVLPDRTHPHMMMQGFSGFIFSGNKCLN